MSFNSTTGLGVAAQVVITSPFNGNGYHVQELSLSAKSPDSSGYQIEAQVQDMAGAEQLGTVLTLTSVANSSGTSPATSVYQGTITGGGTNNFVGYIFVVTGFGNLGNNGTFQCVANTTTSITLANPYGITETPSPAGKATFATSPSSSPLTFWSSNTSVATVTSDGFVHGLAVGKCTVEVSYPTFDNTLGNVPTFNWPAEKVYTEINVKVVL